MNTPENISSPQGRTEIIKLVGDVNLIKNNPHGSQIIGVDAISFTRYKRYNWYNWHNLHDQDMLTVVSVSDKKTNTLQTSYEIFSDGTVTQCEHDPNMPGKTIKRTILKNVSAAGIITTYGPPEKRQMRDGKTTIFEPVVKRELVLVPKGENSQ